jgi:glycosyltransferase involved in cell wall biosynthesis
MLQRALFLVQTSDTEGFPNVFIQAWAQGTPTIGLYYDPDSMIQKNNLGFISGSFDRLVEDTKVLLDSASLRKEMGQQAKQFAAAHFDPEQNVRKLEAFLNEVCEGK